MKKLTPREESVLRHLVLGYSNKQIARELGISTHTIRDHISTLMVKFSVSNRVNLAIAGVTLLNADSESTGQSIT